MAITLGVFYLGIMLLDESLLFSLLMFAISLFMLIGSIVKFKSLYINENTEGDNE